MHELSIRDTNIIKGVALICLLFHHLFFVENGLFYDYYVCNHGVVNELGKVCKVCVALFVFLSGYGLAKSTKEDISYGKFFLHRLSKLMPTFWLIWLLFVPLGVFVFGRTFEVVYVDCIIPKFFLDIFGLINVFGIYGYNATWWFMSCIIMLYALFPFLLIITRNRRNLIVLFLVSLGFLFLPIPYFSSIKYYVIIFIVGIIFAEKKVLSKISNLGYPFGIWVILLIVFVALRCVLPYKPLIDIFVCLSIIMLYNSLESRNIIFRWLHFLGVHSMNIFLFHTFIYAYYFEAIIYSPKNPILIFMLLLCICLIISMGIEKIKSIIGIQKLNNYLSKK